MASKLDANGTATWTVPVPVRVDEHGVHRVGKSRVTLHSVLTLVKQGASPEHIQSSFDVLSMKDIYGIVAWYLANREQGDALLARYEVESAAIEQELEARFPADRGLKERLLARLAAKGAAHAPVAR